MSPTIERILLSGDIEGKPMKGSFDARLDNGRLDAGALAVQHLSVHFPLQVTLNGRDWYIGLREAAQIKLEQIKQPVFPIRLQTPLAFTKNDGKRNVWHDHGEDILCHLRKIEHGNGSRPPADHQTSPE